MAKVNCYTWTAGGTTSIGSKSSSSSMYSGGSWTIDLATLFGNANISSYTITACTAKLNRSSWSGNYDSHSYTSYTDYYYYNAATGNITFNSEKTVTASFASYTEYEDDYDGWTSGTQQPSVSFSNPYSGTGTSLVVTYTLSNTKTVHPTAISLTITGSVSGAGTEKKVSIYLNNKLITIEKGD